MSFNTDQYIKNLSMRSSFTIIFVASLVALFAKVPLIIGAESLLNILGLGGVDIFSSDIQIPQITKLDFFLGIVVAPVLETFLAQMIPIKTGNKYKWGTNKILLASALIFALMHLPVLAFVPGAFVVGVVLGVVYIVENKRGGGGRGFVSTTLVHSLHNFYAFAVTYLITVSS